MIIIATVIIIAVINCGDVYVATKSHGIIVNQPTVNLAERIFS